MIRSVPYHFSAVSSNNTSTSCSSNSSNTTVEDEKRSAAAVPAPEAHLPDKALLTREYVLLPRDLDICCGRGKRHNNHPGNRIFQETVRKNMQRYNEAPTRSLKSAIVAEVVHILSYKGLRFLRKEGRATKDGGRWYVLSASETHEKTSHAIRDFSNARTHEQEVALPMAAPPREKAKDRLALPMAAPAREKANDRLASVASSSSSSSSTFRQGGGDCDKYSNTFPYDKLGVHYKKMKSKQAKLLHMQKLKETAALALTRTLGKNMSTKGNLPNQPSNNYTRNIKQSSASNNTLPPKVAEIAFINYQQQQQQQHRDPGVPSEAVAMAEQLLVLGCKGSMATPAKTTIERPLKKFVPLPLDCSMSLFDNHGMGRATGRPRYSDEAPIGLYRASCLSGLCWR